MKKNKILKILFSDITFDSKEQSLKLNESCQRFPFYKIGGVVVGDKALYVSLEESSFSPKGLKSKKSGNLTRIKTIAGAQDIILDDQKILPLSDKLGKYHIVPMDAEFDKDIASDITFRHYANYQLRVGFRINDKMWAIFEEVAD